ncbi:hypothetical protein [Abditibacterium utsteinense]|nr:hypothetical protein [Abditibacterium utsteinense]
MKPCVSLQKERRDDLKSPRRVVISAISSRHGLPYSGPLHKK